jgi:hypothetical protein
MANQDQKPWSPRKAITTLVSVLALLIIARGAGWIGATRQAQTHIIMPRSPVVSVPSATNSVSVRPSLIPSRIVPKSSLGPRELLLRLSVGADHYEFHSEPSGDGRRQLIGLGADGDTQVIIVDQPKMLTASFQAVISSGKERVDARRKLASFVALALPEASDWSRAALADSNLAAAHSIDIVQVFGDYSAWLQYDPETTERFQGATGQQIAILIAPTAVTKSATESWLSLPSSTSNKNLPASVSEDASTPVGLPSSMASATVPHPTPIPSRTLEGSGQTVTDPIHLDDGLVIFALSPPKDGYFSVKLLDSSAQFVDLLASEVDPGGTLSTALNISKAGDYRLEVDSSGTWRATITQPRNLQAISAPTNFVGERQQTTSFVRLHAGAAFFRMEASGSGYFSVKLLSEAGSFVDLLTSQVDPSGIASKAEHIDEDGTYLLNVSAPGSWRISIEQ